nr:broad substrate specificity ATP-binding cassette transporter ABCG2-like [Marmota flaviventris]
MGGKGKELAAQIIVTLVLGLVTGTIILLLRDDCTEIRNRALMLFFLMVYLCRRTLAVDLFMIQKKWFVFFQVCLCILEPEDLSSPGFSTLAFHIMALWLCSIMSFWEETSVQNSIQQPAISVLTM